MRAFMEVSQLAESRGYLPLLLSHVLQTGLTLQKIYIYLVLQLTLAFPIFGSHLLTQVNIPLCLF